MPNAKTSSPTGARALFAGAVALASGVAAAVGLAHAQPGSAAPATTTTPTTGDLAPRTGLPVGWSIPDAALAKADGSAIMLSEVVAAAEGPVVIVFYRGGWCPYCTRQLADLGQRIEELKATGATLIAISPEKPERIKDTLEKVGSEFMLYSDVSAEAAERFNLAFELDQTTQTKYKGYGIDLAKANANAEWMLPVPAVFVVGKDGVIDFAHADEDYTKRLPADKLIAAAKASS